MTGMLASVSNLAEAVQVEACRVEIIDLKQPAHGALGALAVEDIKQIVANLAPETLVSATIGDLPMHYPLVLQAVQAMVETGVDYIKIGLFPEGDWQTTVEQLSAVTRDQALIAVLFADANPDFSILPVLQRVGFRGVMLDTMDKGRGSLTEIMDYRAIAKFIDHARSLGLLTGLAGSLRIDDIPILLPLAPDYLGFRGALCKQHQRTAAIDMAAIERVQQAFG